MKQRAIDKLELAINILRLSLKTEIFLKDEQTLFDKAEITLCEKRGERGRPSIFLHRGFKPLPLEINANGDYKFNLYINSISDILYGGVISQDLSERLRRVIKWIGRSIEEEDIDLKIIYLCIALESLLTSRSEGKKGQALAFRMLLIHFCAEKPFLLPAYVLYYYVLRSVIIHQGFMGSATKDDYETLRSISTEILIHSIFIIKENGIKNYKEFMNKLEMKERVKEVRSWLEAQHDPASAEILEWIVKRIED